MHINLKFEHEPERLEFLRMACTRDSISHRVDSHSSKHHWQWSISCSGWLLGLSTSLVSYHHGRHSMSHRQGHVTYRSQLSAIFVVLTVLAHTNCYLSQPLYI